jgi:hypothetical protein
MINLTEYTELLQQIDEEIKDADPETAYNVARELSVIYLKIAYTKNTTDFSGRLGSFVRYIEKTLPNKCQGVIGMLDDIVTKGDD